MSQWTWRLFFCHLRAAFWHSLLYSGQRGISLRRSSPTWDNFYFSGCTVNNIFYFAIDAVYKLIDRDAGEGWCGGQLLYEQFTHAFSDVMPFHNLGLDISVQGACTLKENAEMLVQHQWQ